MKVKVCLYIRKEIYEKAKKYIRNMSRFLENALADFLKKYGETLEEREPELVVLVKCPFGHIFEHALIDGYGVYKSDRAYCKICKKQFRVKGRIINIVKGSMELYKKWYSKVAPQSFTQL